MNSALRGLHDAPIAKPQFMWREIVRFLGRPANVLEIVRGHEPDRWRYKIEYHIRIGRAWRIEKRWVDETMLSKLLEVVPMYDKVTERCEHQTP